MKKLFLYALILFSSSIIAMELKQYNQDATNQLASLIKAEEDKLKERREYNLSGNEIKKLILAGADPNVRSSNSPHSTVLLLASGRGWELSRFLLQHGADPNMTNDDNISPLERMAQTSSYEIVKQLIQYGAHVEGIQGERSLRAAVNLDRPRIVELLLENGAAFAIDKPNKKGETPLSIARKGKYHDIVKLLEFYNKQKLQ